MSELSDLVRACFPHPNFRPGQREFIEEAIKAFDGGAKNVIVEAPTGTGKTPGIITIAKYYTRGYDAHAREAIDKASLAPEKDRAHIIQAELAPHQAHMITSLKMLQDQYLNDDKLVRIMKGKNNFLCHSPTVAPYTTCADYEAVNGSMCKNKGRKCEYLKARFTAQCARLTLHNFDSFLAQASLGGSFVPRALLSVDEAHNSDEHLISALAFELSRDTGDKCDIVIDDDGLDVTNMASVVAWVTTVEHALTKKTLEVDNEIIRLQNLSTVRTSKQEKELGLFARRKQALADVKRRVSRFMASHQKPWAVDRRDDGAVVFEPVRASPFAKAALLDFGERRLFMSATVFDRGRRLINALNLKYDETHYIAVPCIFPVANRPLVATNTADSGQENYKRSLPAIVDACRQILDRHKGDRGVIHCNSYSMAREIDQALSMRRIMVHDSQTRDEVVNKFMAKGDADSVLMGVFLREGYDFRDDIARFQIIVRLPYAWPDKRIKMREEIEPGYYDWLCAIDLVQTYGRGVRNEKDHCVTYCLDNRLYKFLRRAGHMMPQWFLDSVKKPAELGIQLTRIPIPPADGVITSTADADPMAFSNED